MGGECCKPKDPLNNNTEIAIKEVKTEFEISDRNLQIDLMKKQDNQEAIVENDKLDTPSNKKTKDKVSREKQKLESIKTPLNHSDDFDRFLILEFQGVIETAKENWDDCLLGSIEKIDNIYSVKIGVHILEGERVKLKNPFLITKLIKEEKEKDDRELAVKGVCYEKILFKKRPTPTFEGITKKFKELQTESNIFNKIKK